MSQSGFRSADSAVFRLEFDGGGLGHADRDAWWPSLLGNPTQINPFRKP